MRNLLFFIGFLMSANFGLAAQEQTSSAPLRAKVQLGASDSVRRVLVHGIRKDRVSLTLEGIDRESSLSISDIKRIDFYLGETVETALEAVDGKDYTGAAKALRNPVFRCMPYLAIPKNNLSPLMEAYLLSLNNLGEPEALREFYTQWKDLVTKEEATIATAWLAYLDAREGRLEGVEKTFAALGKPKRGSEVDRLRHLALCRGDLQKKHSRDSVDHAARVVASTGIDDLLYPEAMYLSAQCYEGLATEELMALSSEREERVIRETLNERVKVARRMEAEADEKGVAPPSEKEILEQVDREAVNQRVPALPALTEISHSMTAQRVYLFLERVFPDTTWGQQASERVLDESREGDEQKLVMEKKTAAQEFPETPAESDPIKQPTTETDGWPEEGRTLAEYLAYIREILTQSGAESGFSAEIVTKQFIAMDVNKNGRATREEQQAYFAKKK